MPIMIFSPVNFFSGHDLLFKKKKEKEKKIKNFFEKNFWKKKNFKRGSLLGNEEMDLGGQNQRSGPQQNSKKNI